jgi:predicted outer membrane repeat protein
MLVSTAVAMKVTMYGGLFQANTAVASGGAVYSANNMGHLLFLDVDKHSAVPIRTSGSTLLKDNVAHAGGGALFLSLIATGESGTAVSQACR